VRARNEDKMQDQNNTDREQFESFVTEGTRRVTEVKKDSNSKFLNSVTTPDPEVSPKAKRRRFSKAYKLRILDLWDKCSLPGEKATLLRREGLYSQSVSNWAKQRQSGKLKSNAKPINTNRFTPAEKQKLMRLELENEKLKRDLDRAEKIIDIQKKVAELLNPPTNPEENQI